MPVLWLEGGDVEDGGAGEVAGDVAGDECAGVGGNFGRCAVEVCVVEHAV